ncbi:GNAT family N-acetyltransferase [Brachybacterium sp. EF45031]|uniref:GNAT family N-acetyltransferase n=1 Tax=Brachybacterium sillae TaxID=2810536 RepID=UPI00217EE469|nr:GNAT family N-acetyltransferase [Brachybacterium sillae]MCS6711186.1 GNAT family N-acetyltransferase [Brachybacterium sillae]
MAADEAPAWHLRPTRMDDVEQIAFLDLELFPDEAWTVFQIAAEVEHPQRRYVSAVTAEDEVIGYAGVMLLGDMADLQTIGTSRPGRGIGRALLAWCEDAARNGGADRLLLEVREDNTRARAFYDRAGFTTIGRRTGYYHTARGPIDAIVMERPLR